MLMIKPNNSNAIIIEITGVLQFSCPNLFIGYEISY